MRRIRAIRITILQLWVSEAAAKDRTDRGCILALVSNHGVFARNPVRITGEPQIARSANRPLLSACWRKLRIGSGSQQARLSPRSVSDMRVELPKTPRRISRFLELH